MEKYLSKLLSWMTFNERVLRLSMDYKTPLLERIKFLSITSTNLDEFFMVRIARLMDQLESNYNAKDEGGYTTEELYHMLSEQIHDLYEKQYDNYWQIKENLKSQNLSIINFDECSKGQQKYLENYFNENIFPVLTPMAVDQSRPFPLLLNKSLTLGVKLKKNSSNELLNHGLIENSDYLFAFVRVPSILPRFISMKESGRAYYIYIESVIQAFMHKLFIGYQILTISPFRITKNAEVELNKNATNFLKEMENYVNRRKWGFPVRLEIPLDFDINLFKFLMNQYQLPESSIYKVNGPINLGHLFEVYEQSKQPKLKYHYDLPQKTSLEEKENIFSAIREKDYLLHRPYEDFNVINKLIKTAINDDQVLAIKQTLYRVSGNSALVKNLALAAKKGKQVTVLVELKARFDEKQNIQWAKKLEQAGCHVVYGFSGYKVHSKILLIIRRDADGIRKYCHFSTGNYNDQTAKLYTDVDLITANIQLTKDASNLFNLLTGYHLNPEFNYLKIAPLNLKRHVIALIDNEIKHAKKGGKSHIMAKMNSLVDQDIIDKLYEASQVGVQIQLIVRSMCSLKSGILNLSENITVKSIIGKYLEHSRLCYFYHGGEEKVFISSADWRPRNLYRRVEQMVPIYDEHLKERIKNILEKNLADTENSWIQKSNGDFEKVKSDHSIDSQSIFFNKTKHPSKHSQSFMEEIKKKFLK